VGATKPSFSMWKARIFLKYTKLRQKRKISANLITDQSTLINGNFATKIR